MKMKENLKKRIQGLIKSIIVSGNKLGGGIALMLAVALGNGCGGNGQYPYQEQQGGAEYDLEPIGRPRVSPEEEEEIHERNKQLCYKMPHSEFIKSRAGPGQDGKVIIYDVCNVWDPPPYTGGFLENVIPEMFAKAGLDWKDIPYRVSLISRDIMNNVTSVLVSKTKYMEFGVMTERKSCMESYPEYSQVVFQNGECNGQNSTRNYAPNNDKHIISKTDIDDVHKKNKDICNKISGHNYTRGETEIIDDNNVTFMDECDVRISKDIWTENVIAELFNRKGLDWTEIPYKIDFILGNPASSELGPMFIIIKTKNMNINVTLEKTISCILLNRSDSKMTIEPLPQVEGYGNCKVESLTISTLQTMQR